MKIAHLLKHVREIGTGIVNAAVDLALLQAADGHDVTVLSSGGEYVALLESGGVHHATVPATRHPVLSLLQAARLRQELETVRPDIVHAHMLAETLLGWTCRFGLGYGLVCTVHNEFQRGSSIMAIGDRIIAVSEASRRNLEARHFPRRRLRTVRNGTLGSPRLASLLPPSQIALERPSIVTVAGLYERKGVQDLIAAFELLGTVETPHLYIVGDGPYRNELKRQAALSPHGGHIHFEGFQQQPSAYLAQADIFVLASLREPFGLVISEAREAGCAVIGTSVDGLPEALDGGSAGLLVPPGDPPALAAAIRRLLNEPEELASWQRVAKANLDWLGVDRVHRETMDVYRELRPRNV